MGMKLYMLKVSNKVSRDKYLEMTKPKYTYSESIVLRNALFFLHKLELFGLLRVWRQNTGMATYEDKNGKERKVRYGTPGISDICGYMRDGRALFIEIKKEGVKKGTPHQEAFIANAKSMRCVAFIAQSNEDIENELRNEGYL